jgi:hypothetical protein
MITTLEASFFLSVHYVQYVPGSCLCDWRPDADLAQLLWDISRTNRIFFFLQILLAR